MTHHRWITCLNCENSYSLPAGEPFDDGSISVEDRLVCLCAEHAKIVPDDGYCIKHSASDNE